MWNSINTKEDLEMFLQQVRWFHDSCIKEMKYLSGAYVDENRNMYPVNDCRVLRVIIQRQYEELPMIEMEFSGLKILKLYPGDDQFTCEILDSTMILDKDSVYWCDMGGLSEEALDNYMGTMICASSFRWRPVVDHMGKEEFYQSKV